MRCRPSWDTGRRSNSPSHPQGPKRSRCASCCTSHTDQSAISYRQAHGQMTLSPSYAAGISAYLQPLPSLSVSCARRSGTLAERGRPLRNRADVRVSRRRSYRPPGMVFRFRRRDMTEPPGVAASHSGDASFPAASYRKPAFSAPDQHIYQAVP